MKLSLAVAIGLVALTATSEAVKVNPLPAPVSITWGSSGPVKVANNFRIIGSKHEILSLAYRRTVALIQKERWIPRTWEQPAGEFPPYPTLEKRTDEGETFSALNNTGGKRALKTIHVEVKDLEADLQMNVDESYTLEITAAGKGTIKSKTIWGALHGLTTLTQIVIDDGRNGLEIEEPVHIGDAPKYTHRGVLYDTARNFYSMDSLKKQIDALSWVKMNVFHWHITDSQSWPLEIKKYPAMTNDAYSPSEI
ncbi:hypothetical protein EC968_007678 [Mortierella alpina]|nr:hypothetical protein EC968_007678 [Mortierella alpina]